MSAGATPPRSIWPDDALEKSGLSGAVGADQSHQRATLHHSVEVMDGRMAIVTERHVPEMQRRRLIGLAGRRTHAMTQ
jgi:hypothetical protein